VTVKGAKLKAVPSTANVDEVKEKENGWMLSAPFTSNWYKTSPRAVLTSVMNTRALSGTLFMFPDNISHGSDA